MTQETIPFGRLVTITLENSRRLSRTAGGLADNSASEVKHINLHGEDLSQRARLNEARACELVWEHITNRMPGNCAQLTAQLFALASAANAGIIPEGKVFRDWIPPEGQRCPTEQIPHEIDKLMEDVWSKWSAAKTAIVAVASAAEWKLNGGFIHPFYDGCGRISRLFSSQVLLAHGLGVPLWEDRERYFAVGSLGGGHFEAYMRERIRAASEWPEPERSAS